MESRILSFVCLENWEERLGIAYFQGQEDSDLVIKLVENKTSRDVIAKRCVYDRHFHVKQNELFCVFVCALC